MEEGKNKKNLLIYIGAAVVLIIFAIVLVPRIADISKKSATKPPASYNVTLTKDGFEPKDIVVKKGDVVVWTNQSGKQSSVNSADQPDHQKYPFLNLGIFEDGQTLQTPFVETGKFEYVNHLNPKNTGTVTVTE